MSEEEYVVETKTEEEAIPDYLCKECGQAPIDYSENANSQLCGTCREKYIHYPISKFLIFLSIILVILIGISFTRFPKVLGYYRMYENAEEMAANGEVSEAIAGLYKVLDQYPDSKEAAIRLVDIAMDKGNYSDASDVMSDYLVGKKMSDDTITRLEQYVDIINRYYDTLSDVDELLNKLDASLTYEEAAEAMTMQLESRLKMPNQDRAVLYYYLFWYSSDIKDEKMYLNKCIEEDDTFYSAKVKLGDLVRREGDLGHAKDYYNQVLRGYNSNVGALRGLAIVNLLEGDKAKGLSLASQAYEKGPDELYVLETYLIALKENGKDDEIDKLVKEYVAKGNEIDYDTQDYLDGKITLKDYYIDSREEG